MRRHGARHDQADGPIKYRLLTPTLGATTIENRQAPSPLFNFVYDNKATASVMGRKPRFLLIYVLESLGNDPLPRGVAEVCARALVIGPHSVGAGGFFVAGPPGTIVDAGAGSVGGAVGSSMRR
jgi:hypothetical protein